jgi:uncharacterized sulfatase
VVEFVDIYPTLVELAGVPAPDGLSGRSLVRLLENPLREWDGDAVTQVLRPADDRLSEAVMGVSIRTERWRYTEWGESGKYGVELYDYHTDPGEFDNLALDPSPKLQEWISKLRQRMQRKASNRTPSTPFNPARL